jgi:hypothetical protein
VDRAAREHHGRERDVGAAIHHDLDVLGRERSIARDAGAHAHHRGMALGGGGDVLEPVVHDLDRAAALPRQQRGVPADHRGVLLLAAEASARHGLGDPHLVRRQPEDAGERLVHVVGALERAAHEDPALRRALGDHAVVLDVELLLVAAAVLALDDPVGGGKAGVEIAARDRDLLEDVVAPVEQRLLRQRLLHREHRLERLALDPDRAGGGLGTLGVLVREEQDGLLRVADLPSCEQRLVVLDQRHHVVARDVAVVGDRDAAPIERGVEHDAHDAAARNGRAHRAPVEHPGNPEVVHVARAARDLVAALEPGNGDPDRGGAEQRRARRAPRAHNATSRFTFL